MKKILFIGLAVGLGMAAVAHAGYEAVAPSSAQRGGTAAREPGVFSVTDRAAWRGSVELPGGVERGLVNAGGRFPPLQLEAGAECKFAVSGPGLVPGRTVVLSCSCGGLVEGGVVAETAVPDDGVLRFAFKNGTFGAQPVELSLLGERRTLLLVHAVPAPPTRDGDSPDDPPEGPPEDEPKPTCDNEDPPMCTTCPCLDSAGPNRFNVYSANVKRQIEDLRLPIQVGEKPLAFARTQSSRTSWAVQERTDFPFGRAGNWRHSHQWTVLDDGETNGCRKLQVIAPDGRVSYYNKKSPNDLFLTYLPSTHSRVAFDGGTNYYLYELDGTKYHITQSGTPSAPAYRMEGFWDAYSNHYAYAYDADGWLTRVSGPNTNHFFALEYRPVEGAVPPGTVRFTYADATAAEVLLPGSWNNWTGTATPMQDDGTGVWTADVVLPEGCHEYKFAVRPRNSAAWRMVSDPDNPIAVGPSSNSLAVVSTAKIVSRVVGGDGREVAYTYDWDWNDTAHSLAMRLREVAYGTGESALYDYYPASVDQGRSILLKSADDPHGHGEGRAIFYTYHTERDYSGQIHEERLLSTGEVLAALEYAPANPLIRHVVSADGTTNDYSFVSGAANTSGRTDAAGQTVSCTYFGGDGMLESLTDPMGRTTTYTRTWHFGAELAVSNSCSCRGDHVNTYTDETYPFYLASVADAMGNVTSWQRDALHRPVAVSHPDGTSEAFQYNAHGQPVREVRRDGTAWTNAYDARGRLVEVSGPEGAWTGYGYDAFDRVSSETNAVGLVTRHEYDWEGRKTRTLHPDGTEERWAFDRYGNVTQAVDRAGGVSLFAYDARGNLVRATDPSGAVTLSTYDAAGRKATETTPGGLVTSNRYDVLGRLVERTYSTDGTSERWTYVYDGVATYTDRLGNVTSNAYDADGHLVSVTDPRGNATAYAYDALGRRIAVTDALGRSVVQTLDPAGRATAVTDAAGLAQANTYDANGRLVRSVLRGGITNDFLYDAAGRRTETLRNGVSVAAAGYDAAGRVTWTRNADGLVVSNVYDAAGRLWKTVMPDGTFAENVYSNAFLWKNIDRAGRTTTTDRDRAGRPVRVTDAAGGVVQYRYDPLGNLTNLVDQAGTVTTWTYDPEGRQTRKTYADSSHYDYTYDAEGRLASCTDAKNQTTTYAYDPNGNLTNILYPDASTVIFTYDALNRKTAMTDSIGTTAYAYDILGNLVTEDGPFANDTLYYDYTPDRQLAAITSAFYNVEYAYDALGRLSTVVGAEGTNTYAYTTAGTLWTNLTLANGTTAERQFDALLRLTNLVNRAGAGVLSSFALTLDDADQRTQVIREDGKVYTYGYDAIGQLTNASASLPDGTPWSGYQFSYTYDATGNPIEQDKNGLVYSNSFNNLNQNAETRFAGGLAALGTYASPLAATVTVNNVQAQLHEGDWAAAGIPFVQGTNALVRTIQDLAGRSASATSTVVVADRAYAYDANGNMTTNGVFTYVWDCENRLTEVWKNGTLIQSNRYDALWRRREKIEYAPDGTATTSRYIYKDWLVLAITDASGALLETFTHGADLSGDVGGDAGGIGGILASSQAGGAMFYSYDFSDNVVLVTSSDQSTFSTHIYTPFGIVFASTGSFTPRYQFSTKEYDFSTALTYYGYRYYATKFGRWMSMDLIGEQGGVNLYAFCTGNPIDSIDPTGLDAWTRIGGAFQMVGGTCEAVGGCVFAFVTAETGIGVAGGLFVAVHGSDVAVSGFRKLWTGESTKYNDTCTSQGLQALGMDREWANLTDSSISIVGSMGLGAASQLKSAPLIVAGTEGNYASSVRVVNLSKITPPVAGMRVYRVYGGKAVQMGRYWTPIDPRSVVNYRNAAGLPNDNTGEFLVEGLLHSVKNITVDAAAPIGSTAGGLIEYVIQSPSTQITVQSIQQVIPHF